MDPSLDMARKAGAAARPSTAKSGTRVGRWTSRLGPTRLLRLPPTLPRSQPRLTNASPLGQHSANASQVSRCVGAEPSSHYLRRTGAVLACRGSALVAPETIGRNSIATRRHGAPGRDSARHLVGGAAQSAARPIALPHQRWPLRGSPSWAVRPRPPRGGSSSPGAEDPGPRDGGGTDPPASTSSVRAALRHRRTRPRVTLPAGHRADSLTRAVARAARRTATSATVPASPLRRVRPSAQRPVVDGQMPTDGARDLVGLHPVQAPCPRRRVRPTRRCDSSSGGPAAVAALATSLRSLRLMPTAICPMSGTSAATL